MQHTAHGRSCKIIAIIAQIVAFLYRYCLLSFFVQGESHKRGNEVGEKGMKRGRRNDGKGGGGKGEEAS